MPASRITVAAILTVIVFHLLPVPALTGQSQAASLSLSEEEQPSTRCLPDSPLHFLAGMSACFLGAASLYPFIETEQTVRASATLAGIGFSFALVGGGAKELLDRTGLGIPEWRDFAWTAAGGALASSLVFAYSCSAARGGLSPTGSTMFLASGGLILAFPVLAALLLRWGPESKEAS